MSNYYELTKNWPIIMRKVFRNVDGYNYSFYLEGYREPSDRNDITNKGSNVWVRVTSKTSCQWIYENKPNNIITIKDINEDEERFGDCRDYGFVDVEMGFNQDCFDIGKFYLIDNERLVKLVKFQSNMLELEDYVTKKQFTFKLEEFVGDCKDSYSYVLNSMMRYRKYRHDPNSYVFGTILFAKLSRIKPVYPCSYTTKRNVPNKNIISYNTIYEYKNTLCTVTHVSLDGRLVQLTTIDPHKRVTKDAWSSPNTFNVPFKNLHKITPVLYHNGVECQYNAIPKIQCYPQTLFKIIEDPLVVTYMDSKGSVHVVSGVHLNRTSYDLKISEDTNISLEQVRNCYTIKTLPIPTNMSRADEEFIYNHFVKMYWNKEESKSTP